MNRPKKNGKTNTQTKHDQRYKIPSERHKQKTTIHTCNKEQKNTETPETHTRNKKATSVQNKPQHESCPNFQTHTQQKHKKPTKRKEQNKTHNQQSILETTHTQKTNTRKHQKITQSNITTKNMQKHTHKQNTINIH